MQTIEITNPDYKDFVYNVVLPRLNESELTKNNIDTVYDYIVENFELVYIQSNNQKLQFIDNVLNYLAQFMDFVD